MKTLTHIIAVAAVALIPVLARGFDAAPETMTKLDIGLSETMQAAPPDSIFDVLISTGKQTENITRLASSATSLRSRYTAVSNALRAGAARNQRRLVDDLTASAIGKSQLVRQYWITDIVRVRTDRDGLLLLAQRDDVSRIIPNVEVDLVTPVATGGAPQSVTGASASLDAVGIRSVWAAGTTGKGRLVASIDTGVEGVHPALAGNWRGRHGDTAAAWFDPTGGAASPGDDNGHGTHVMGTMVGHDGADTIGLAPDAEWITAAVIDRGTWLAATIADILSALEWVSDPDGDPLTTSDVPDVVCNSWGISQTIIEPCDDVFFDAIDNVEAMGIVCVFAAGNEGPNSMTLRNPADHATSPTSSFSVGAVDQTIAGFPVPSFSSRGPSACDGYSKKPEIAAPGVAIRSAYKGQSYRTINGTSMATPFVAAAVALLRQYNPDLTPETIKQLLMTTAEDIGDPGEDNESGHGLLNIAAALAAAPAPTRPDVRLTDFSFDYGNDAILAPGETAPLTITLAASVADAHNLVGELRPLTPGVSVTVDSTYYGSIVTGATASNGGSPFVVAVPASISVGDSLIFELVLSGDPVLGVWKDTIGMLCGLPDGGMVRTVDNGTIGLSLSNFGQLGLGPNSALDAGGAGWFDHARVDNVLYEAALMVTTGNGAIADASRGASFDFAPASPVTVAVDAVGATQAAASYTDSRMAVPIGIAVDQTVTVSNEFAQGAFAIVEWQITNTSGSPIAGLRCGLMLDIDVTAPVAQAERILVHTPTGGFYHTSNLDSRVAGIVPLTGGFGSIQFLMNSPTGKSALSSTQKIQALQAGTGQPEIAWGDAYAIVGTQPRDLAAGESVTLAVAFIIENSEAAFSASAGDAERLWAGVTDVTDTEDENSALPRTYLDQNYPNPFNPETVIAFSLPREMDVRLEVFNLLGQKVAVLANGRNPAGHRTVVWDGTDTSGRRVASGVYFYRLVTDAEVITRKMVMLR